VQVDGVSKTFKGRGVPITVLKDINLQIGKGELLVLLGPSGCGKTTLLRCLVGLERPNTGTIDLRGDRVVDSASGHYAAPNRRDVAMVFQNYALWPHMTVRKNIGFPLRARRMQDAIKEGRIAEVLAVVQCTHLADRYPPELSGGQQQRVSLARALATRPSLLLLDEPLSNLDVLLRVELRAQIRLLHRQLNFTGVYVTHDQEEAFALGTRIAVMNLGRIEQIGKPLDVYNFPATEYVADFLGARNRFEASADGSGNLVIAGQEYKGAGVSGLAGEFVLRARDLNITLRAPQQSRMDGGTLWLSGAELIEILPGGEKSEYVVQIGENRVFASVPNDTLSVAPGDSVDVGIDSRRVFCYDETSTLIPAWSAAAMVSP
jgi:iron(III) transport system ATP-binding protein